MMKPPKPQVRFQEAEDWVFEAVNTLTRDAEADTQQRNRAFKRLMSMYGLSESLALLQYYIREQGL